MNEVKFENADESAALVEVEIKLTKGDEQRSREVQLHLIKSDGQWFIDKAPSSSL